MPLKKLTSAVERTAFRKNKLTTLILPGEQRLFYNRTDYSILTADTLEGVISAVLSGLIRSHNNSFCLILEILKDHKYVYFKVFMYTLKWH